MNTRIALATLTLAVAASTSLAAHAATTPVSAPAKAAAKTSAKAPARHKAGHRHVTHPVHASLDRLHLRVAAARDAEQQRWIAMGLRSGQLNLAQVAMLERAQAGIDLQQARLARHGHESVDQALAMQHLQDVQDWAIRTSHAEAALQVDAA